MHTAALYSFVASLAVWAVIACQSETPEKSSLCFHLTVRCSQPHPTNLHQRSQVKIDAVRFAEMVRDCAREQRVVKRATNQ